MLLTIKEGAMKTIKVFVLLLSVIVLFAFASISSAITTKEAGVANVNDECDLTVKEVIVPTKKKVKSAKAATPKSVTVAKPTKEQKALWAAKKAKRAKDALAAKEAKALLIAKCREKQTNLKKEVVYSAPITAPANTIAPAKVVLQEQPSPKKEFAIATPKAEPEKVTQKTVCGTMTAKESLEAKLKEKNDIVYAVTATIKEGCNAKEIVRAAIEMHHAPCLVITTAIQAGANHEQVILGSIQAGATSDVIAKCSLENEGLGYTPNMPSPPSIRTNCIGCGRTTVSTFRFRL